MTEGTLLRERPALGTVHDSRTLMVEDLDRTLLSAEGGPYQVHRLRLAVLEGNVLGKRTARTRLASWRYLNRLYQFGGPLLGHTLVRTLWNAPAAQHGVMALLLALRQDQLLRLSTPFVQDLGVGAAAQGEELARYLRAQGVKSSEKTLRSSARNLLSSWTQAGWLTGGRVKRRQRPVVTAPVVALALLQGYLDGERGLGLLETRYVAVLDTPPAALDQLAHEAAVGGWLTYRRIGEVLEIHFPQYRPEPAGAGSAA